MEADKEKMLDETWATILSISRIVSGFYDKNLPHLEATEGAVRKMHLALAEATGEIWHEKRRGKQERQLFLVKIRRLRRQKRKLRVILSDVFDILEDQLQRHDV